MVLLLSSKIQWLSHFNWLHVIVCLATIVFFSLLALYICWKLPRGLYRFMQEHIFVQYAVCFVFIVLFCCGAFMLVALFLCEGTGAISVSTIQVFVWSALVAFPFNVFAYILDNVPDEIME